MTLNFSIGVMEKSEYTTTFKYLNLFLYFYNLNNIIKT